VQTHSQRHPPGPYGAGTDVAAAHRVLASSHFGKLPSSQKKKKKKKKKTQTPPPKKKKKKKKKKKHL
jgi:hypothetical protein